MALNFHSPLFLYSEHGRRLDGEVLSQVIAEHLLAVGLVKDADEGVVDHAEVLPAALRLIDRHRKGDALDVGRHLRQVDADLLVIPGALAGEIVAQVLHRAGAVAEIAVEDEVPGGGDLTALSQQEGRRVQIEVPAGIEIVHVPAQAHDHLGEAGIALGQADFLSFL